MTDRAWDHLVADGVRSLQGVPGEERFVGELKAYGRDALAKGARPAHLTASLVVLDLDLTHVLLTHHRKAQRWLQFGGHLEPSDQSFVAAAIREGREESGLPLLDVAPVLVEVDAHELGPGFTACREHLDVRFGLAVPRDAPVVSHESHDVAWWPVDALPDPTSPSLPRLVARAVARLSR